MNIKYDILGRPLELYKTHDFCKSGKPVLTVVFLHGIASSSATFANALKYLEGTPSLDNVRFITFDLLGVGKSYKSDDIEYNYTKQLEALDNSLKKLKLDTPLILAGHSMGTLIATRYASKHKKAVSKLILLSPPVYTEKDLDDPRFELAMEGFKKAVSLKDHSVLKDKQFNDSLKKIVKNRNNYQVLCDIAIPTILIYGDTDEIIGIHNIPKLVKANPNIKAIKTIGKHGISHIKYYKVKEILEEDLNA